MLIDTGDVQPYCQLYPDLKKTSTEEITASLALRLTQLQNGGSCNGTICSTRQCICGISCSGGPSTLPPGIPLENINLQVKLYVSEKTTQDDVNKAIDYILEEFKDLSTVNSLFISTTDASDKELLLKCWPWLEDLAKSGKVQNLGLSDPRCSTIQPLIEQCEIWPKGMQLLFKCEHISDTCIDLLKLANYYKIRTTIHRDDFSNIHELRKSLKPALGLEISESCLAKYSIFDSKRKVILKKGYLVDIEDVDRLSKQESADLEC